MGRPKGSKNKKTLEREKLLAEQALTNPVLTDSVLNGPAVDQTDSVMTQEEENAQTA